MADSCGHIRFPRISQVVSKNYVGGWIGGDRVFDLSVRFRCVSSRSSLSVTVTQVLLYFLQAQQELNDKVNALSSQNTGLKYEASVRINVAMCGRRRKLVDFRQNFPL